MTQRARQFRLKFATHELDLTPGVWVIGRSPACNITIDDTLVSRRHARLTVGEEQAVLDDLGSRNGTLVNGEPIFDDHRLGHHDRILIGTQELVFIDVRRSVTANLRNTGFLVACSSCGLPFPVGAPACPHCGVACSAPADQSSCLFCQALVPGQATHCPHCGKPLTDHCETTATVSLSEVRGAIPDEQLTEIVARAIAVGRFAQATTMIDDLLASVEESGRTGQVEVRRLATISRLTIALTRATANHLQLGRVIELWSRTTEVLPDELSGPLLALIRQHAELGAPATRYLAVLDRLPGPPAAALALHLREVLPA